MNPYGISLDTPLNLGAQFRVPIAIVDGAEGDATFAISSPPSRRFVAALSSACSLCLHRESAGLKIKDAWLTFHSENEILIFRLCLRLIS